MRTSLIFNFRSYCTKAHPIPYVNPVIATQQSPYFYLIVYALILDKFI